MGFNRGMPKQDAAAILGEILSEADALIRLRLTEQGLDLSHLVVGATPDNQIVVRSNGDAEVMRSFGEDLKNVADELEPTAEAGRHDAVNENFAPDPGPLSVAPVYYGRADQARADRPKMAAVKTGFI